MKIEKSAKYLTGDTVVHSIQAFGKENILNVGILQRLTIWNLGLWVGESDLVEEED